jgi:hypothetical protein
MFHVLSYKTDIVPVILCGSLMSKEEITLKVIESRVVMRIFDVRGR